MVSNQEDLTIMHLLLKINLSRRSNSENFYGKRDESFYNSLLPQFGNSIQCESSWQKLPA